MTRSWSRVAFGIAALLTTLAWPAVARAAGNAQYKCTTASACKLASGSLEPLPATIVVTTPAGNEVPAKPQHCHEPGKDGAALGDCKKKSGTSFECTLSQKPSGATFVCDSYTLPSSAAATDAPKDKPAGAAGGGGAEGDKADSGGIPNESCDTGNKCNDPLSKAQQFSLVVSSAPNEKGAVLPICDDKKTISVNVGDKSTGAVCTYNSCNDAKTSQKFDCKLSAGLTVTGTPTLDWSKGVLTFDDTTPAPSGPPASLSYLPATAWLKALKELGLPVAGHSVGHYYDRTHDRAVVFLNANAQPYFPMLDVIDEDDDITVVVVDRYELVKAAQITISGCNRPPQEPRVNGNLTTAINLAGKVVSKEEAETQAKVPPNPYLGFVIRPVGKCDGSSGGIFVTAKTDGGGSSSVNIPVNPLYRFAVGVAVGYDGTQTRSFSAVTPVGQSTPRVAESDDIIGLTSLVYVSLYLDPRDFRKKDFLLWQRAQIFVGLDPRDLTAHLLAGAAYELVPGMSLMAGWRVLTKQQVLQEGSGLTVGSAVEGPSSIMTRTRWEVGGPFVALGLSTNLLQAFK